MNSYFLGSTQLSVLLRQVISFLISTGYLGSHSLE